MNGERLACLYSYKCEKATKLGINEQLLEYIQNYNYTTKKRNLTISLLKKLVSYSGYQMISKLAKKNNCFDRKVVKAYWLGDRKLTLDFLNHNFATLEKFSIMDADGHWSLQTLKEKLECAISFGKVIEVGQKKTKILHHRLLYKMGKVDMGEEEREVDTGFGDNLEKGNWVSVHYGIIREKISLAQIEILEELTLRALKASKMA